MNKKIIETVYNEELNCLSLTNEIDILKVIVKNETVACLMCFKNQNNELLIMPNITKALKLLFVNPATSATAERSFFLARSLKSWMQSVMFSGRLNLSAVLHKIKTFTSKSNSKEVETEFPSCNKSRVSAFGTFL